MDGVAAILAQLKEDKTRGMLTGESDAMEEGEEPAFTFAEETKRAIRREERKKKKSEEFRAAKETCTSCDASYRSCLTLSQSRQAR